MDSPGSNVRDFKTIISCIKKRDLVNDFEEFSVNIV